MARKGSLGRYITLIVIILFAGVTSAQRFVILKALFIAWIIVIALAIIKSLNQAKAWRASHDPNLKTIDNMSGLEFERYVAKLLKSQGYSHVRLTEKYDLGVDIVACKDGICWGIQVKRYSGLVKASAVRQVVTALRKYDCDRAMVVTNSTFSRVAIELANSNDCVLIDRDKLF